MGYTSATLDIECTRIPRRRKPSKGGRFHTEHGNEEDLHVLLVITQPSEHGVQLFERDEPAAVIELVLIDGCGQLRDFRAVGVRRRAKLATLRAAMALGFSPSAAIDERASILFENGFHYDTPRRIEPLEAYVTTGS